MNEHQDNSSITEPSLREEREGIGVVEELIPERPVHRAGRWEGQGEHIQRGYQVDVLEFLWLPHCMHYLPINYIYMYRNHF